MIRRLLYSKSIIVRVVAAILVSAFALAVLRGVGLFLSHQRLLNDTEKLLSDYSNVLSSEQITDRSCYAPKMRDLIRERRSFYAECFEVGLHSNLESITSEFLFEPRQRFRLVLLDPSIILTEIPALLRGQLILVPPDAEISVLSDDQLSVQVGEMVTLYGRYKSPPEEYPMVQAGLWALSRTDNEAVKREIEEYVQRMMEDREPFEEGFEITDRVQHSLIVIKTQDGLRIVQDSFTNRTAISSGEDNVTWVDGQYVRNKPDFTQWPNCRIYDRPIEELGKIVLDRFSRVGGEDVNP